MSPLDMESPPAGWTAEGPSIAVGANAGATYSAGAAAGKEKAGTLAVPRAVIEQAVLAMIGLLDMDDGDADAEPDDPAEHSDPTEDDGEDCCAAGDDLATTGRHRGDDDGMAGDGGDAEPDDGL